jgi:hypothetical protein
MRVSSTAALIVVLSFGVPLSRPSFAQDESEPDQALISREQWRANVEEARRRVDQIRREGSRFAPPPQSAADASSELFQKLLEDDSLRPGDIVSTDRGMLIFKGRSSGEPGPSDFAPIDLGAKKP